jgi:hypothetical protein
MKKLLLSLLLSASPFVAYAQTYPSPTFQTMTLKSPMGLASGGTGGNTAATARAGLGAAASGANSDITSLTGLTTPLSVAQGGTGAASLSGFATSGANTNITSLTIPSSGQFYKSNGANINEMNDRIYLGAATVNPGNSTDCADYVSQNIQGCLTTSVSQFASLSTLGQIGILGGTETSMSPNATDESGLAVVGVAINNAIGANQQIAEGGYFEAQQKTGAGYTTTVEADSVNQSGTTVVLNPFNITLVPTASVAELLGSGGGRSGVVNSSVGLGLVNNGAEWDKGIVFGQNSIASNEAIVFPEGYGLQWWDNSTTPTGGIYSNQTTGTEGIELTDNGIAVGETVSPAFAGGLFVSNVANAVNYIDVVPQPTGYGPEIVAAGSDANAPLTFAGKGTGGVVAAGNFSATGTIKTQGYTVSTLPAGIIGERAYVMDAAACTLNGTLTGGGSTFCPVIYNGSAWVGG